MNPPELVIHHAFGRTRHTGSHQPLRKTGADRRPEPFNACAGCHDTKGLQDEPRKQYEKKETKKSPISKLEAPASRSFCPAVHPCIAQAPGLQQTAPQGHIKRSG